MKLQKTGESILFVSVERGRGKLLQRLLIQASRQRFDAIIFVYHIWDGFDLGERFRSIALEHSDRILHVGLCDRHADKLRSVIRSHDRESVMALSNTAWMMAVIEETDFKRTESDSLRVGMISNLTREKGADTFTDLASMMSSAVDSPEFVLAGPIRDDSLEVEIQLASSSGVLDYVGSVPSADRHEFIAGLDALVFPTRYRSETEPLIVLEALRLGVPVVATSVGCLEERLPSQWLLPPGADLHAWEALVRKVIESPDESRRLAREIWAECEQRSTSEITSVCEWIGVVR